MSRHETVWRADAENFSESRVSAGVGGSRGMSLEHEGPQAVIAKRGCPHECEVKSVLEAVFSNS